MAGFKTHITTSTVLGIGYGAVAAFQFDMPIPACILAAGMCSVSGMLPDLDSDSGVPLRESIAFAAAVIPALMMRRFKHLGLDPETIVLISGIIYLFIRFGVATALKKYTVHRGMFHSIPAALIAAEVTFLVCEHEDVNMRYFFSLAVLSGFMSHLILDEIWSIDFRRFRLKKSFGTAIKFYSDSNWANVSTYGKVALLTFLAVQDPVWMNAPMPEDQQLPHMAEKVMRDVMK